jgi:hypothetical protein
MSPNNSQSSRSNRFHPVRSLDFKQAQLLAERERLVIAWAEAMAHGGDGDELLLDLIAVEHQIHSAWPEVWEARSADWIHEDAALIHSGGGYHPACPTCRREDAHRAGIPEAA